MNRLDYANLAAEYIFKRLKVLIYTFKTNLRFKKSLLHPLSREQSIPQSTVDHSRYPAPKNYTLVGILKLPTLSSE